LAHEDAALTSPTPQLIAALVNPAACDITPEGIARFLAEATWVRPAVIPTTYNTHAVDFDGSASAISGIRSADALASAANYLKAFQLAAASPWGMK